MLSVTVSPKFQVVIPQAVRAQLGIQPGQRLQVLAHGQSMELLPLERARVAWLSARPRHHGATRRGPCVNVVDSCGWTQDAHFAALPGVRFVAKLGQ